MLSFEIYGTHGSLNVRCKNNLNYSPTAVVLNFTPFSLTDERVRRRYTGKYFTSPVLVSMAMAA